MALNGQEFMGLQLKISRPKDYICPPGVDDTPPQLYTPGIINTTVADSAHKIFIGSIPNYLESDDILQVLLSLGQVKAFTMTTDSAAGQPRGLAFCEFVDQTLTHDVIEALNGIELGDQRLIVQLASSGSGALALTGLSSELAATSPPTTIIALYNIASLEELAHPRDYQDIFESIKSEVSKFGTVQKFVLPKPRPGFQVSGLGKVFRNFLTNW
jgi:splicing factor U2AF subunit